MGLGLWIATAMSVGVAYLLFLFAHFEHSLADPFYTFGSIFLALGITLGASNGLKNALVLIAIFAFFSLLFIGVNQYDWDGLRGVL